MHWSAQRLVPVCLEASSGVVLLCSSAMVVLPMVHRQELRYQHNYWFLINSAAAAIIAG